jgi:hypothetical protein
VVPRAGLDILEKRNISCSYRDNNSGSSSPYSVAILTTLDVLDKRNILYTGNGSLWIVGMTLVAPSSRWISTEPSLASVNNLKALAARRLVRWEKNTLERQDAEKRR